MPPQSGNNFYHRGESASTSLRPAALRSSRNNASKKITAVLDGGRITSDGGVMVLAQAERRLAIAEKLAAVIADPRDPLRLVHRLPQILRARILAIDAGSVFAADRVTLGERPEPARGHPAHGWRGIFPTCIGV